MKKTIFDKKNVLVIGGAGFIGSHICDELVKTCKVICLDNFITGDERNIDHLLADPNFEFIKHDINAPIDLDNMVELEKFKMKFQGVQEIYNLACPTSPFQFDKNRLATIMSNSYGIKNALDLAVKYKAKFMHFSSSVVYGLKNEENKKISEEYLGIVDFTNGRNSYDEGKRFAETIALNYKEIFNLDIKIIRIFRIYGPRMKLNEGHMIPDMIVNAIEGRDLEIFGDDKFSSSLCYVNDVVEAAIKLMESEFSGPYNIGSDLDVNMTDLAKMIIEKIGSKSNIKYSKQLIFMTPLFIPDTTKARNDLSWMPVVTLPKGLELTIEDMKITKGLKRLDQNI